MWSAMPMEPEATVAEKSEKPASAANAPLVRVLLTGGPGAGKSSALATLRDRISKRGFQVIVVPENATALLDNSGGYDPAWHGTSMHVRLQQLFLKFQIEQEDTYRHFGELRPSKPHLLLHDRGCLDGRLFCTDQQWNQVLEGVGVGEEELLKRYDLVIHMTTVASGMEKLYDYGPGSTNPSRYHTPEQARHADVLAQEIYAGHPRVCVVPNFPEFNEKMEAVVRCVTEAVQVDGLAGPRERRAIAARPGDDDPLRSRAAWPVDSEVYDIQVTFLDVDFTESVRRRQLVPPCSGSTVDSAPVGEVASFAGEQPSVLYEFRQELQLDGKTVRTRRVLTADAYLLLKQARARTSTEVRKQAVCFTWQGHYYELCSYTDAQGGALPESCSLSGCRILDCPLNGPCPPWLAQADEDAATAETPSKEAPPAAAAVSGVVPKIARQLSRNATAEVASGLGDLLKRPSGPGTPPVKRKAADADEEQGPRGLKRRLSVPETSSLSKVVAGSLSPARFDV